MRVLVLGASGMLGSTAYRLFAGSPEFEVIGTLRSDRAAAQLPRTDRAKLVAGVAVDDIDGLMALFAEHRPDIVINCVGLIKQLADSGDPLSALPVNSILPHRLSRLCRLVGARLIHVSTDCVFSGQKGGYRETDTPDATDVYGRSKLLGEVHDTHAITLRTSIIGLELAGANGLVGWFLSQSGPVNGFTRAIFSGLPTVELCRVMRDIVIPRPDLSGLYHVAAEPIAKYDLLQLVARTYGLETVINPDGALSIDRSLDASRFRAATGYVAPGWPALVAAMRQFG